MIHKMKKIKEEIRILLEKYPAFRDNDHKLISAYYYKKLGGKEVVSDMSAIEFLQIFSSCEYASAENITRVRRKLQEQFPELRGDKYNERHHIEEEVRNEIHDL